MEKLIEEATKAAAKDRSKLKHLQNLEALKKVRSRRVKWRGGSASTSLLGALVLIEAVDLIAAIALGGCADKEDKLDEAMSQFIKKKDCITCFDVIEAINELLKCVDVPDAPRGVSLLTPRTYCLELSR